MSSLPTESHGMHLRSPGTNCDTTGEVSSTTDAHWRCSAQGFYWNHTCTLSQHTPKSQTLRAKADVQDKPHVQTAWGQWGTHYHLKKVSYQCENCYHSNSQIPAQGQTCKQTFHSTRRLAQVLFPKQHPCMWIYHCTFSMMPLLCFCGN